MPAATQQEDVQQIESDVSAVDTKTPEAPKARKPRAPRKKKTVDQSPTANDAQVLHSDDGKTVIKIKLGGSSKAKAEGATSPTGVVKQEKIKRKQAAPSAWQSFLKGKPKPQGVSMKEHMAKLSAEYKQSKAQ